MLDPNPIPYQTHHILALPHPTHRTILSMQAGPFVATRCLLHTLAALLLLDTLTGIIFKAGFLADGLDWEQNGPSLLLLGLVVLEHPVQVLCDVGAKGALPAGSVD